MSSPKMLRHLLLILSSMAWLGEVVSSAVAGEVLIADRLQNTVYRYTDDGDFIGVLIPDDGHLSMPAGLTVSPDRSKIYVANTLSGSVIEYDYDYGAGTATYSKDFATGLAFPNTVRFSPDGNTVYISQLGGGGVARYNPDGTSAGAAVNGAVGGGAFFQFSGLAFAPSGELLVGAFSDFPAGANGAVAKSDAAITTLGDFIPASPDLNGVGNGLFVLGDALYVPALTAGTLSKFQLTGGGFAPYPGFTMPTGLAFPADLIPAPDGNGLLVGELGINAGTSDGQITRFSFDGAELGIWALPVTDPALGFTEPTALVAVPEPSSLMLAGAALAAFAAAAVRRRRGGSR